MHRKKRIKVATIVVSLSLVEQTISWERIWPYHIVISCSSSSAFFCGSFTTVACKALGFFFRFLHML